MNNRLTNNIPSVDLVIVIDTSPSIKDEAQALSRAADAAINKAQSICPSNLRVTWLGIEGIWKGTKFNRTIRNYLTKECNIPQSSLKGRKRGILKSAGAQEDGARAIEDISDYFNWRENAVKAIFYLGDEALEGGGAKTEADDIAAADLALGKATAVGVTIHTYFGTSKSKYREGIAAEYQRLATETGGQFFSKQDNLKDFSAILEKVICGSRSAKPATAKLQPQIVYVQDCIFGEISKLYTLDIATGEASFVGSLTSDVYDIAFVGSQLYGIDQESGSKTTKLVKINSVTGEVTEVGDIGFYVVGLAYNPTDETLYATAAKKLIKIDLETGRGQPVMTVSRNRRGCGEVTFARNGNGYISLIGPDKKKMLATCNLKTKRVKIIGNIGFPDLASMEFIGDELYGVTGNFFDLGQDGQLIRIDTKTGKGTLVTTTTPLGRWAGMTIGEPVTETLPAITPDKISEPISEQESQTITEAKMKLLTIDTKENCYLIDTSGMDNLQQNVASSLSLTQGTYNIQITSGRYKYSSSQMDGEPAVILWIYGEDGSTFINKNTGFETGATWTTLNGYNDRLQLEVKERTVVCALFFDTSDRDRQGSVSLLVSSEDSSFTPQELTVDSQQNCYILNEQDLSSLKQWDSNFVEIEPGNYRIKIREGNASYWSEDKKFDLEPWALIWIKAGKFIPKLSAAEVDESWCSLNGFQDELILEVKQKTTLSGFFFDTYKEDNEGQIVLAIESLDATEFAQVCTYYTNKFNQQTTTIVSGGGSSTTTTVTSSSGGSTSSGGSSSTTTTVTSSSGGGTSSGGGPRTSVGVSQGGGFQGSSSFSFRFDEAQMEQMWQQMATKIKASVAVTDEQDRETEARYWDSLEKWILKGYQNQANELAMQIARMEFMMKTMTQQMEVSFNQNFQAWSGYFDNRLNDLIATRLTTIVNEQVNLKIADQGQNITNQVVQRLTTDMDNSIDTIVNQKITNLSSELGKEIENRVTVDLGEQVANAVKVNIENRSTEINTQVIEQLQTELDDRIGNIVDLKVDNLSERITQAVQEKLDERIDAVVNAKNQDLLLQIQHIQDNMGNLHQEITQTVLERLDERIDAVVNVKNQNLLLQIQQIQDNMGNLRQEITQIVLERLDEKINSVVNVKTQDLLLQIQRIEDNMGNLRQEITQTVLERLDEKIDAVVNVKLQDLILKVEQIQGSIDNKVDVALNSKIAALTQSIKNQVIEQVKPDIDQNIKVVIDQSNDDNVDLVFNNVREEVDNLINANFENKLLNFRNNDLALIIQNELNHNFTDSITAAVINSVRNQQFFHDIKQAIENDLNNFYARLGQFETQLYLKIEQGDTQVYNWTLQQLQAIQGCLTDRQSLVDMFESFAAKLKDELDSAPCVQPTRFTAWVTKETNPQLETVDPGQLPGS
ncbi:MAG: hypothetical protein AB4372_19145 [Xenococcus sp. (in: cyanobacteria)]